MRSGGRALGLDPARVFRRSSSRSTGGSAWRSSADAEVDVKAVASALGGRQAALASAAEAERATGYVLGGISPLGTRRPLPTVLDASAAGLPTIHVSAGRRGLEIELAPDDLVRLTGGATAAIARRS
jgi:Cys-tRNA(Pro)/Cys-tRNA(Cys) deacylase